MATSAVGRPAAPRSLAGRGRIAGRALSFRRGAPARAAGGIVAPKCRAPSPSPGPPSDARNHCARRAMIAGIASLVPPALRASAAAEASGLGEVAGHSPASLYLLAGDGTATVSPTVFDAVAGAAALALGGLAYQSNIKAAKATADLEELQNAIGSAGGVAQTLSVALQDKEEELQREKTGMAGLKGDIDAANQALAETQAKLDESKSMASLLEGELTRARVAMQQAAENSDGAGAELAAAREAARAAEAALEAAGAEMERRLEEQASALSASKAVAGVAAGEASELHKRLSAQKKLLVAAAAAEEEARVKVTKLGEELLAARDKVTLLGQELHQAQAASEVAQADSEAAMSKLHDERVQSEVVEKARAAAVKDTMAMMSKIRDLEFQLSDAIGRAQAAEAGEGGEGAGAAGGGGGDEEKIIRELKEDVDALRARLDEAEKKAEILEKARAAAVKDTMKTLGDVRDLQFELQDERDAREELEKKASGGADKGGAGGGRGEVVELQGRLADALEAMQRAQARQSALEGEVTGLRNDLQRERDRGEREGAEDMVVTVSAASVSGYDGDDVELEVLMRQVRQTAVEETRRRVEESCAATLETERRHAAEGAARRAAEVAEVKIREARNENDRMQDENTRLLSQLEAEREKVISLMGNVRMGAGAEAPGTKPTIDDIDKMIGRQLDECIKEWGVGGSRSSMRVGQKKELLRQFFYPGTTQ